MTTEFDFDTFIVNLPNHYWTPRDDAMIYITVIDIYDGKPCLRTEGREFECFSFPGLINAETNRDAESPNDFVAWWLPERMSPFVVFFLYLFGLGLHAQPIKDSYPHINLDVLFDTVLCDNVHDEYLVAKNFVIYCERGVSKFNVMLGLVCDDCMRVFTTQYEFVQAVPIRSNSPKTSY